MTEAVPVHRHLCLITGLEHSGITPVLHGPDRIWSETNCYTDLWLGVLSALRLDPHACLAYTLAVDFLDDQWTFFKPSHDDLFTLYGIDVQEMNVWRPLIEHVLEHLSAGRLVITEADAWWLPDTAGTDYHQQHTKTTIVINEIDTLGERLGYFHNTGYFHLEGEDYRGLFRLDQPHDPNALPLLAEVVNLRGIVHRPPDTLRHISRQIMEKYLERVPTRHPVRRWTRRCELDLPELTSGGLPRYHAWAFSGTRQMGSAFELAALHLNWLAGSNAGTAPLLQAADSLRQLSVLAKAFILKGARAVLTGRPLNEGDLLDRMARHWSRGMQLLGAGEIVLDSASTGRPPSAAAHDDRDLANGRG